MASDLELMQIEVATLWVEDERGRLVGTREPTQQTAPHLVIATSHDGLVGAIGSEVEDSLAAELRTVIGTSVYAGDPGVEPVALGACRQLLHQVIGPLEYASGPSYLVPRSATFASRARIERSDSKTVEALKDANPPLANWSTGEWSRLLEGVLGPWAMAVIDEQVISICHTARLGACGVEAGLWTDPDFRGQGHAAAVTTAWASVLPAGRHLFYSTTATNRSSQRVAARLALRCIGWMWQLLPAGEMTSQL